jgi:hypothetical protein
MTTPLATTPSPSTSPRSPSSRGSGLTRIAVLVAVVVALLTGATTTAWFLRDPEPEFDALQGILTAVQSEPAVLDGGVRETRYRLTGATGLQVQVAIREALADSALPAGTKRPVFLILGGQRRGAGAGALLGERSGIIIASLDYPFDGDQDAKGLALLAQVPAIRRAFYATPPGVSLALDHLLSLPRIDSTRIELVGASFGAPFATIAAARDPRVSRLWVAHGGGRPLLMIAKGLEPEIPFAPLRWPVAVVANVLASGPRFAPERFVGRVAPRPVIMLNAQDDERIPRASVDALWAAVREPREQVWLPGMHMQGSRPEVLRTLVDSVMARAARPSGG